MTEQFNINQFNCSISGKGQSLVWAHGLCGSMQSEDAIGVYAWHRFPKKLQLIRYDAIGHGLSTQGESVDDYLWPNLAKDMLRVAEHYRATTPLILGGQSMGCATSLFAVLAQPENVKGLVLMTPPVAWQARAAKVDYYHKIAKAARILGGKGLAQMNAKHLDKMLPSWIIDAHKHSVLGMLDGLKSMKRQTLNQLFTAAALNDLPTKQQLSTIQVPTLILAWQGDEAHPIDSAISLNKSLPNATLHIANSMDDFNDWPALISDFCIAVDH
ncbi:alpha/beta fold hydrolase [Shewanella algicola]|uniref:alpha/beta fold hydrolase n=1 Tax=Shewanella algicola TaxID=640633 RepID=UPI002494CC55|nr:alpha/beta hydrolase [Shewanella algicola]